MLIPCIMIVQRASIRPQHHIGNYSPRLGKVGLRVQGVQSRIYGHRAYGEGFGVRIIDESLWFCAEVQA